MKVRGHLKITFLLLNMVLPIMVGGILYYLFCPQILVVRLLDNTLNLNVHISVDFYSSILLRVIRNYLLDFLWAYALVFAVYFFIGNKAENIKKALRISVMFGVIMEMVQLSGSIPGTFDMLDILVEFCAEMLAAFIIKNY